MRVLITGASTGIGAATAAILKGAGAYLTVFDIVEPELNADRFIRVDLSSLKEIDRAAASVEGDYDALLNIAGLPPRPGNAADVLAVNFLGLRAMATRLLPRLVGGGAIVSLASRAGEHWRENIDQVRELMACRETDDMEAFVARHSIDPTRAYGLSKEAVIAWTMAETEFLLSSGLRANTVSPSAVDTPIIEDFRKALGERAEISLARTGRAATAIEIAELVVFLANPESNWLKGANVTIDGGISAMMTADSLKLEGELSG